MHSKKDEVKEKIAHEVVKMDSIQHENLIYSGDGPNSKLFEKRLDWQLDCRNQK